MLHNCRKAVVCLLAFICFRNYCQGQLIDLGLSTYKTSIESPYRLDPKKDVAVSVGALALIGTGFLIKTKKPKTDPIHLLHPNIYEIPSFDRYATHKYNNAYLAASDILEYTAVAMPFLAFFDKRVTGLGLSIIALYLETIAINTAAYNMTTAIVDRRRPLTYNTDTLKDGITPEVPFDRKTTASTLMSFYSGHTSNAAAATFYGARVFTELRPHSVLVPFVWAAAAAVPAFVGFSRIEAGKHYPSDVVAGYIIGASIGFFNPMLHKIKDDRLTLSPSYDGGLSLVYSF
jgi:membrane-associated phospholipid phosphatase